MDKLVAEIELLLMGAHADWEKTRAANAEWLAKELAAIYGRHRRQLGDVKVTATAEGNVTIEGPHNVRQLAADDDGFWWALVKSVSPKGGGPMKFPGEVAPKLADV